MTSHTLSKADAVKEKLLARIFDGSLAIGDRIGAEPELCREFGVGRNTLREAVSSLVHEGLLERKQGSGTYVRQNKIQHNPAALSIALPIHIDPDTDDGIAEPMELWSDPHLAGEAVRTLDALGHFVALFPWHKFDETQNTPPRIERFDAFLVTSPPYRLKLLQMLVEKRIPHIAMESEVDLPGVQTVMADDLQAAYDCTRRLLGHGHRRIGFLSANVKAPQYNCAARRCLTGFRHALAEAGVSSQPEWIKAPEVHPSRNIDPDYAALTREMLDAPEPPSAVVAVTYRAARWVRDVCQERGLSIPGDLSLIAPLAESLVPEKDRPLPEEIFSLSGCRRDISAVAQTTIERLLTVVAEPSLDAKTIRIPLERIEGRTVAPCPQKH